MSARASSHLLRAGVVLIMAMFIGAPTPGYVSGCSSDGGGGVDPQEFCRERQWRVCARDNAAGRIDDAGYQQCLGQIDVMCAGFNFGPSCSPTRASISACYAALLDPPRIGVSDTELPECRAICGGSGGGGEPEGI